jgi:hypothetical protein
VEWGSLRHFLEGGDRIMISFGMMLRGNIPLKFAFPDIFAIVGNKRALIIWIC